jgi:hypothetical protein
MFRSVLLEPMYNVHVLVFQTLPRICKVDSLAALVTD